MQLGCFMYNTNPLRAASPLKGAGKKPGGCNPRNPATRSPLAPRSPVGRRRRTGGTSAAPPTAPRRCSPSPPRRAGSRPPPRVENEAPGLCSARSGKRKTARPGKAEGSSGAVGMVSFDAESRGCRLIWLLFKPRRTNNTMGRFFGEVQPVMLACLEIWSMHSSREQARLVLALRQFLLNFLCLWISVHHVGRCSPLKVLSLCSHFPEGGESALKGAEQRVTGPQVQQFRSLGLGPRCRRSSPTRRASWCHLGTPRL